MQGAKMRKSLVTLLAVFVVGCGSGTDQTTTSSTGVTGNSPTVSVTASSPVPDGNGGYNSTIIWHTTNATEVAISGFAPVSASSGSGSQTVNLTGTTRFAVRALGPGGTSSTEITIELPIQLPGPPKPTPAAPPSVTAEVTGSSQVTVTWYPVDNATSYNLYMDNVLLQEGATSPYVVSGLTIGTEYTFTVTAVYTNPTNHSFESAMSYPVSATPVNFVYVTTVTVSWTLPTTYSDGSEIPPEDIARIVITVFANTTGNVPWGIPRAVSDPGSTSVQFVMTVPEGTTYYFTGTATLDGQVSDYSVPMSHYWGPYVP
jgi:hypothetical protein